MGERVGFAQLWSVYVRVCEFWDVGVCGHGEAAQNNNYFEKFGCLEGQNSPKFCLRGLYFTGLN